jgi:hypothetical protein
VELLAGDSQFESQMIFSFLESCKMSHVFPWRRLKRRVNPDTVLSVKDRIDVEGPEHLRSVYHRFRAPTEGLIGRVKNRLGFRRLTWQGVDIVCIHVGLVLCVAYAVCIAACRLGRRVQAECRLTLRDDGGYDGVELEDAVHESHV